MSENSHEDINSDANKKCWYGLVDATPTQKTDPTEDYFASLFVKDDNWETCTLSTKQQQN